MVRDTKLFSNFEYNRQYNGLIIFTGETKDVDREKCRKTYIHNIKEIDWENKQLDYIHFLQGIGSVVVRHDIIVFDSIRKFMNLDTVLDCTLKEKWTREIKNKTTSISKLQSFHFFIIYKNLKLVEFIPYKECHSEIREFLNSFKQESNIDYVQECLRNFQNIPPCATIDFKLYYKKQQDNYLKNQTSKNLTNCLCDAFYYNKFGFDIFNNINLHYYNNAQSTLKIFSMEQMLIIYIFEKYIEKKTKISRLHNEKLGDFKNRSKISLNHQLILIYKMAEYLDIYDLDNSDAVFKRFICVKRNIVYRFEIWLLILYEIDFISLLNKILYGDCFFVQRKMKFIKSLINSLDFNILKIKPIIIE